MHLLCRAFGHAFGESAVEQRREERAHGTYLVVREYWTCGRCGVEEDIYSNRGLISTGPPNTKSDPGNDIYPSQADIHASPNSGEFHPNEESPKGYGPGGGSKPPQTDDHHSTGSSIESMDASPADGSEYESGDSPTPVESDIADAWADGPGDEGVEILQESSQNGSHPQFSPDQANAVGFGSSESDGPQQPPAKAASGGSPGAIVSSGPTHRCANCGLAIPLESSPYMAGDICADCGSGYITQITEESPSDWEDQILTSLPDDLG